MNRVEPGKDPVEHYNLWILTRSFPRKENLFRSYSQKCSHSLYPVCGTVGQNTSYNCVRMFITHCAIHFSTTETEFLQSPFDSSTTYKKNIILAMVGILNRCSIRNCSCSFEILNFGLPCIPVNIVLAAWELVHWLEVIVSFTSRRRSITLGSIPSVPEYLTRILITQSRRNII